MLAVVFPGQGAQKVGMSADVVDRDPEARAVLEAADEAFGGPLSEWIRQGPEDRLRRTEVTQPAVLAASVAVYRVLEPKLPLAPAFFAGHSLGEYTALVAAGALELGDAIRLVRMRGALMQEAVPEGEGAMLAVLGLPAQEVEQLSTELGGVYPANYNAPGQTVIAGQRARVEQAAERLRGLRARVIPLDVSAPFHCPLMAQARDQLAIRLKEAPFRPPVAPVVSNASARPYRTPDDARQLLREQVCAPVRWIESVQWLVQEGVRVQLEVGPGSVLTGLAARIDRKLERIQVSTVDQIDATLERLHEVLA